KITWSQISMTGTKDRRRTRDRITVSFPKTTLVAGGFKLDQLLVEPFQSFHAALICCAYEADGIVIGGYGFGDTHVNRALQNPLLRNTTRPPIMLLTWPPPDVDPMEFRQDAWSHALTITLHAPTGYAEPGHQSPPMIDDLVRDGGFEVSKNYL